MIFRGFVPIILLFFLTLVAAACGGSYPERHVHTMENLATSVFFTVGENNILEDNSKIKDTEWKKYDINHPPVNKFGTTILWLKILLPEKKFRDPVLFFPSGSYNQPFDAYIGSTAILKRPQSCLSDNDILLLHPMIIPLPDYYSGNLLYLRFESSAMGHVGITAPVYLASEKELLKGIINRQADRLILGFIFIFSGLVSLLIFMKNLRYRFFALVAFAVMSMSFGVLVIFASDITILFFVDPFFSQYITILAVICFPVGLFLFIDQTIGPGYKKIVRRSWQLFLLLAVMALLSFATGIKFPNILIIIIRATIFTVSIIAAMAEMIQSLRRRNIEARVISTGLILFGITALIDEISFHRHDQLAHMISPWGYFLLMNLLGYLLYRAFEITQRKLRRYSEELEEKSAILQDLNRTLEERVQERTEELRLKNNELNEANKILFDRNRIIENEIAMARKIQQQLIPEHDPSSNICSLYRPMDQVGGDFYDYVDLGDGRMGIFISDVSGHGIPAALITSMIKMTIYQAESRKEDPASLFAYLNDALFGQTVDNFVTAFYGIIDYQRGTFTFCNAGHNAPLIIASSGTAEISGRKSFPIASMHNDDLVAKGKMFQNNRANIAAGSKILLYTDGLTEAVNSSNTAVMFESLLPAILEEHKGGTCHHLVHNLFDRLVDFRGHDSFEDDVCIVCIEC